MCALYQKGVNIHVNVTMNTIVEEKQHLAVKATETRVYKRRWWIMAVFSFFCFVQSAVWSTWGPIAESAEIALGWSDFKVGLPSNLADIGYFLFVLLMCMMADTKGLRFSMLLSTSMMMVITVLRCISLDPTIITITAYFCGFVEGIAATVPFACPPLVAAVWFPPKERPVATALGSFCNYFGITIFFIVGPQLVPGPMWSLDQNNQINNTAKKLGVDLIANNLTNSSETYTPTVSNMADIKDGISNLMYTHAALAVAAFLLCLVYFPAKPPRPPSITASIERVEYKQALAKIVRNGPLWLVVIAGGLPSGVAAVWIIVIDVVLKDIGVNQIDAGWIGFWNTLTGCIAGIVISKFSDFFNRRRKIFLLALFICAAICCTWFSLICTGTLPFSLSGLYAAAILIGICVNGTIPLFYDICAEASYPVAEGVTGGFFTMVNNVFGIVFLSLIAIPNIGTAWMNWAMLVAIVAAIPMLFAFPERYRRTDIDLNRTVDHYKTDMS